MAPIMDSYAARVSSGALAPDPAQENAARKLEALIAALGQWKPDSWFGPKVPPRGLYMWGAVGRGKSMLMDLFFDAAPVDRKRRVHFHEFMLARHKFLRDARQRAAGEQDQLIALAAKDVAEHARLLCLDELQVTDIADAMILGRLFEQLIQRGVVIVITSNRPPDDLYKNGLNRQLFLPFIALIKERLDVVEVNGAQDWRLEKLMAAPVYHTPLGADADKAMDDAWKRLTLGAAPHSVRLEVQGRVLNVTRAAAGCARFTFEELCARPLGPADYLEIAERFHTVLIDRVPKLTPDKRSEAARFRTLIDALYDTKTKLVLSAAAEPEGLYPEGDQSFEFQRTASRLIEMRSKDYLAAQRRDLEFRRAISET